MQLRIADTADQAAEIGADVVARSITDACRRRGVAHVAFSGGSTPAAMLAILATMELPWAALQIYQVDERIVADEDPRRNLHLLHALDVAPGQLHVMPVTASDPRRAAARYAAQLPLRLDLVHLGLGDDGHTASWPPGDQVVDDPGAVAVSGEYRGTQRMTLTAGPVNGARRRLVLVAGADKARPLAAWLGGRSGLPIERVRRTNTVVVADRPAAAGLVGADR